VRREKREREALQLPPLQKREQEKFRENREKIY
jgi:hypothetical protein